MELSNVIYVHDVNLLDRSYEVEPERR